MNAPVTLAAPLPVNALEDALTNPLAVLQDDAKWASLLAEIEAEASGLAYDLSTDKGRSEIKSLAYKVARTKTAIDDAGKKLNEDARAQINKVDARRKTVRETLDAKKDAIRKPLTDWESAEEARIEKVADWFAAADRAVVILNDDTAAAVAERTGLYRGMELDPALFGDSLGRAEATRLHTIETLDAALARLVQSEADAAELAALRAQSAAQEAEKEAARVAEAAKVKEEADAAAAKEREAEIAAKAAADAQAETQRQAEAALAEQARAHQAELDAIQKAADDKAAAEKAEADLTAQREKNRAHVSKIMGAAKLAIMGLGIPEEQAVEVVKAIKAGSIPNVSIAF